MAKFKVLPLNFSTSCTILPSKLHFAVVQRLIVTKSKPASVSNDVKVSSITPLTPLGTAMSHLHVASVCLSSVHLGWSCSWGMSPGPYLPRRVGKKRLGVDTAILFFRSKRGSENVVANRASGVHVERWVLTCRLSEEMWQRQPSNCKLK